MIGITFVATSGDVKGVVTRQDVSDPENSRIYPGHSICCNSGDPKAMVASDTAGKTAFAGGCLKRCEDGDILLEPAVGRDPRADFIPIGQEGLRFTTRKVAVCGQIGVGITGQPICSGRIARCRGVFFQVASVVRTGCGLRSDGATRFSGRHRCTCGQTQGWQDVDGPKSPQLR